MVVAANLDVARLLAGREYHDSQTADALNPEACNAPQPARLLRNLGHGQLIE